MKKSFNQVFIPRKSRTDNDSATIYCRITIDGVRTEFSIQRSCPIEKWNAVKGKVRGNSLEDRSFNSYLNAIRYKLYDIFQELLVSGEEFSGETIKAKFLGLNSTETTMLMEVYEDHNLEFELLVGKGLSYRTLQKYRTIKKYLEHFLAWKYGRKDYELDKLDYDFIKSFEVFIKTKKNCCHNTTMDYIKKIKKIANQCVARNLLERNPFSGYKISSVETHKTILSEAELSMMATIHLQSTRLELVRDIFLFSCYTGLAYCDVVKLTPDNLITGIDGEKWVSTNRSKTNTISKIPLLPLPLSIIEKYSSHPRVRILGKLLPVISNQKMNSYLKELAQVCKVRKDLTFHCARHTFATTVTLTNGVPIETVSKMLGHKSLRTTQHYAKILDIKVSEDMSLLRRKIAGSRIRTKY
jgi:site-specific recombinase XerD